MVNDLRTNAKQQEIDLTQAQGAADRAMDEISKVTLTFIPNPNPNPNLNPNLNPNPRLLATPPTGVWK